VEREWRERVERGFRESGERVERFGQDNRSIFTILITESPKNNN